MVVWELVRSGSGWWGFLTTEDTEKERRRLGLIFCLSGFFVWGLQKRQWKMQVLILYGKT
jgi:hypothetical protein